MGGPGSGRRPGGGEKTLKANLNRKQAFKNAPSKTVKNLIKSGSFKTKKAGLVALKSAKRGERYRAKAQQNYNSRG